LSIAARIWRGSLLALVALLCTGACARAATVTEFSDGISLESAPFDIVPGPDGNMWFTEHDADQIGRITPSGVVTEFFEDISLGSGPTGITSGPDGNLWFTEYDAGRIGRITPAGVVTEFSAGITPGSSPREIVTGADGNLWYTDTNGRRIGRVTPAGVVTEFSVDTHAGGGPSAITAGPDGNLWFTQDVNPVGRITPAGAFTPFASSFGFLTGIAAGPDGNLWTTEYVGPIQRMTTAGVVTGTFALPARAWANGIAAGPDGNLWFTGQSDASIGRITLAGQIVLVTVGVSPGSAPRGIAAGPDGNLWFTEMAADQIGRITPSIEPPLVAVADAAAVAETTATLAGTVDARSLSSSVRFDYGMTDAYGLQTAEQLVAAASEQPVSAAVTSLLPATTYHYRLVAASAGGSAQSADRTFTTPAAAVAPPPPAPRAAACSNGVDDDRDGFADAAEPRCHADADRRNAGSYLPQGATESPVDDPVLVCSAGGLALVSVELTDLRRRIRLRGVAGRGQSGRRVGLYADGRRVASARVQRDGSFVATFKARRRAPTEMRYQARLGTRRSQSTTAQRRFAGISLQVRGARVRVTGRILGRRPRSVDLLGRAGGCGAFKSLATARARVDGRFVLTAAPFAEVDLATYYVRVGAAGAAGQRESTSPRAITLR
jgi:streptogramin lyase